MLPGGGLFQTLDATFDGMILLGYHAMNGTVDGVLHHTQSKRLESQYRYDGIARGELYQHAVLAGHFDVPVILVTGDTATCREARETLGDDLPTVAVKHGIARETAVLLAAADTRVLLIEGARRALAYLPTAKPLKPEFPIQLTIRTLGPNPSTPESPHYRDNPRRVENGLEIMTGQPA